MKILDQYIEEIWASRSLYPGLGSVVSVLADLSEGEPQKENTAGQMLVDAIRQHQTDGDDLLDVTFGLLERRGTLPPYLANHKNAVRDAKAGLRDNKALLPALRKLSLFALTPRQVAPKRKALPFPIPARHRIDQNTRGGRGHRTHRFL